VGSGVNQKTRQLGSCSGLHAYFGWLCQCFSISFSLTFFFFSDNNPSNTLSILPVIMKQPNHTEEVFLDRYFLVSLDHLCNMFFTSGSLPNDPFHQTSCNEQRLLL
jgi:hypothetical protein